MTVTLGSKLVIASNGTRRDAAAAIRAYRKAIASDHTTDYGREEAQYHLAVALVDRDAVRSHREVERLLNQAAQDGDYPQATQLLARLAREAATARFVVVVVVSHVAWAGRPVAHCIDGP